MTKKLNSYQVQELLKLHETGMGYQFIEAEIGYSQKNKYLVLNSELLIDDTPNILHEVQNVLRNGYRAMLFSSSEVELKNIRLVEILSNYNIRSFSVSAHAKTGAIHQKKEVTTGSEIFTRVSAYPNDFRVDTVNNKLIPGSFSTTLIDYNNCKRNQLNPIDRYALPNDELIAWAYHIIPLKVDLLQRGIVEPANNHNGGGIEIYFEQGTSNKTFIQRTAY